MEFKKYVVNGTEVKYRGKEEVVLMPESYNEKEEYFRAVWVTPVCNDFQPSPNKEEMKANLLNVLSYLEKMNMNAIVFHVRTYNNAYYRTKLAPIDSNFGTYESFGEWDYLKWFIDECHSRGIEFHAWLNPYRIKSEGFPEGFKETDIAELYKDFPVNPASDPKNILLDYGTGAILNPCKEVVQQYIIDVCLEFMANYNVDAVHFDDYFYVQMSERIEVLKEADQDNYVEYIKNNPNCGFKEDCAKDKKDWRRMNVDNFVYNLSCAMKKFNKENNRQVQLGISPTGIYRNGNGEVTYDENGTAITNGSNTVGQEHYESYLFCDAKKWVDNEWIDYIVPQTYWAFTHPVAGFADVTDWWTKVVRNKKVNLYCGMGLYLSYSKRDTCSWKSNPDEASDQVLYCANKEFVKGTCIFSFRNLVKTIDDDTTIAHNAIEKVYKEYWANKVKTPKTMANEK